jgi:hypothetical protein
MHRIRSGRPPVCFSLLMACGALMLLSAPLRAQSVVVTTDSIMVRFPAVMRPDSAWPAQTLPDPYSAPAWAISMRAGEEWLHATLLFSLEVPALPAYPSLAVAIRAASLRSCEMDAGYMFCARELPGIVGVAEGAVFFASPLPVAWRRAVSASRPEVAYLRVTGPGPLRLAVDTIRITYTDGS